MRRQTQRLDAIAITCERTTALIGYIGRLRFINRT